MPSQRRRIMYREPTALMALLAVLALLLAFGLWCWLLVELDQWMQALCH